MNEGQKQQQSGSALPAAEQSDEQQPPSKKRRTSSSAAASSLHTGSSSSKDRSDLNAHRGNASNRENAQQKTTATSGITGDGDEEPNSFMLKHQNRQLATHMFRYKKRISRLLRQLTKYKRRYTRVKDLESCLRRIWDTVDHDIFAAVKQLPCSDECRTMLSKIFEAHDTSERSLSRVENDGSIEILKRLLLASDTTKYLRNLKPDSNNEDDHSHEIEEEFVDSESCPISADEVETALKERVSRTTRALNELIACLVRTRDESVASSSGINEENTFNDLWTRLRGAVSERDTAVDTVAKLSEKRYTLQEELRHSEIQCDYLQRILEKVKYDNPGIIAPEWGLDNKEGDDYIVDGDLTDLYTSEDVEGVISGEGSQLQRRLKDVLLQKRMKDEELEKVKSQLETKKDEVSSAIERMNKMERELQELRAAGTQEDIIRDSPWFIRTELQNKENERKRQLCEKSLDALKQQLENVKLDSGWSDEQLQTVHKKVARAYETQIEELDNTVEEQEEEISRLHDRLYASEEDAKLKREYEMTIEQQQGLLDSTRNELSLFKQNWKQKSTEGSQEVQECNAKLQSKIAKLSNRLEERDAVIEQLKRKEKNWNRSSKISRAGLEPNALHQQIEKLNYDCRAAERKVSEAREKSNHDVTEREKVESTNSGLRSELEVTKQERDRIQQMVDTISTDYENIESRYDACLKQMYEKDRTIQSYSAKIESLKNDLMEERKNLQSEKENFEEEKEYSERLESNLKELQEVTKDQHQELESCKAEIETLRGKLDVEERYYQDLESAKHRIEHVVNRLSETLERLCDAENKKRSLEAENRDLRSDLDDTRGQLAKVKEQARKYREQAAGLEQTESQKEYKRKERELETYRRMFRCSVNHDMFVDCALTTCGHCFSKKGILERLKYRSRQCPACAKKFNQDKILDIYFVG